MVIRNKKGCRGWTERMGEATGEGELKEKGCQMEVGRRKSTEEKAGTTVSEGRGGKERNKYILEQIIRCTRLKQETRQEEGKDG